MEGNNECSNVTSVLALEVTQEQRDAIYYFFAHNDWDFKEANYDQNNVNNSESNDLQKIIILNRT